MFWLKGDLPSDGVCSYVGVKRSRSTAHCWCALSPPMIKASALSVLLGGLACLTGCQGEPASPAGAGSTNGGGGAVASGGSGGGAGMAQVGGSSSAGNGGQAVAGANTGGAAAGGVSAGGVGGAGAGGGGGGGAGGGTGGLPPLQECNATPSVDRLTSWSATNEGTMVPASGSILVKDGADFVGKVEFVGGGWHVLPVLIANKFDVSADLSKAASFTLTYSATAELHVQLRSKSHWNGGDQYATTIPSTGGKQETHVFSFAEAGWKSLFGTPTLSYADTLKEGMGLVFVGDGANTVVFYGLRIDGYTPPCQ